MSVPIVECPLDRLSDSIVVFLANRLVVVIELLPKVIRTLVCYILELGDLYVVLLVGIESAGVLLPCLLEPRTRVPVLILSHVFITLTGAKVRSGPLVLVLS